MSLVVVSSELVPVMICETGDCLLDSSVPEIGDDVGADAEEGGEFKSDKTVSEDVLRDVDDVDAGIGKGDRVDDLGPNVEEPECESDDTAGETGEV